MIDCDWDGLTVDSRATLVVAELLSRVKLLEATLASMNIRTCVTCKFFRVVGDHNYCSAGNYTAAYCVVNGFHNWQEKEVQL